MSLKGKIEAIIYAAEEPVTVDQMATLLRHEVLADMAAQAANAAAAIPPFLRKSRLVFTVFQVGGYTRTYSERASLCVRQTHAGSCRDASAQKMCLFEYRNRQEAPQSALPRISPCKA